MERDIIKWFMSEYGINKLEAGIACSVAYIISIRDSVPVSEVIAEQAKHYKGVGSCEYASEGVER